MLHIKFHTFEHSCSEEEDFLIIFMYFCGSNLESPSVGPSWAQGPLFGQTW